MHISQDIVEAIAYRFEQMHGRDMDAFEQEMIEKYDLATADPSSLAPSLVSFIQADDTLDESLRISVYWALAKKFDPSLIDFFADQLELELKKDSSAVYQLLIALDNLNENVFGMDRDGYCILDTDLNRRDAMVYLKNRS